MQSPGIIAEAGSAPTEAVHLVRAGDRHPPLRRFSLEIGVLLLLLSTFALVEFQDLFARQAISLRPDNLSRYTPYWYNDGGNGGRSAIAVDGDRPLRWSCELRAGYQYPYCGYGILFDSLHLGRGIDLVNFDHAVIRLRYSGPGEMMRMNFTRTNPLKGPSSEIMPGEISFPVVQGVQEVELKLDDLAVPLWWVLRNHADSLSHPPRDNITAIELQPGKGARVGRHLFVVESITFEGRQFTHAQFYLGLLVLWVTLISLFLLRRVFGIRRDFEQRQARQVEESRELRIAKTEAESASAAKSAFLANMSHELRTPLNAILGYAQLLEREELTDRQGAAARIIHQSGAHLLTLITDILDLSKIEAGRADLSPGVFDLHACVGGVAEMMHLRATEKNLDFACSVAAAVPRLVVGDERRLRQVLINLLGNAIRFTHEGKVALLVSASATGGGGNRLKVEICDTGLGIAEAQLERIFEPFEQLGDADRQVGGTGLGLTISRQIVGQMGGRIEVESKDGQGSRFWFEVPLVEAVAAADGALSVKGAERRALIVEHDPAHRAMLVTLMAELGFAATAAGDGPDGVDAAAAEFPDLVLIRLDDARAESCETLVRLRCLPAFASTPILAFSPDPEAEGMAIASGADRFLPMPLALADLVVWLATSLPTPAAAAKSAAAPAAPEAELVPPPPEQLQNLLKLAMAGNMRAIRTFADDLAAAGPEYAPFAERLKALAAGYQSPAILELVSRHTNAREVA